MIDWKWQVSSLSLKPSVAQLWECQGHGFGSQKCTYCSECTINCLEHLIWSVCLNAWMKIMKWASEVWRSFQGWHSMRLIPKEKKEDSCMCDTMIVKRENPEPRERENWVMEGERLSIYFSKLTFSFNNHHSSVTSAYPGMFKATIFWIWCFLFYKWSKNDTKLWLGHTI